MRRGRGRVPGSAALLLGALVAASQGCATPAADAVATPRASGFAGVVAYPEAARLAQQWGIEITSIRLSAADHMIDYRYRVLDAEKATDLFKRQIKPHLVHQASGKVLEVPATAKVGPLRNSNTPQQGRIYWMFFGNAGKLVRPGDKVSVVIGEFRVEDLVVQ